MRQRGAQRYRSGRGESFSGSRRELMASVFDQTLNDVMREKFTEGGEKPSGTISPPRRVQIIDAGKDGDRPSSYFKKGQFAYVIGFDTRGGFWWQDKDGDSAPGDMVYMVSKTKNMRGGASWFSEDALRFTKLR